MRRNYNIWLIACLLGLSACQWKNVRHQDFISGIQTGKEVYDEVHNLAETVLEDNEQGEENHTEQVLEQADAKVLLPAPLTDRAEIRLMRKGYVTSYNTDNRICNWVAWHLTASHIKGSCTRKGMKFTEDTDVPVPRATHYDYIRSGYDRGHMCPAGDNKWDTQAMRDCFLLTNICPQNHNLNVGDWHELENACRKWAEEYGAIDIVCGPILLKQKHKTIGKNKIMVPEAFFKVILCRKGKPKAIGFIYRNMPGNRPKVDYVNSVDEVERITGIDFFADLPDDIEKKVESTANLNDWN